MHGVSVRDAGNDVVGQAVEEFGETFGRVRP
jgi:hypothetical protein